MGKRVEVHYRAGDVYLPAIGALVADTGRSIFLEEQICRRGKLKTFRWEIPYPYIVHIVELGVPSEPPAAPSQEQRLARLEAHSVALGLRPREGKV